MKCAYLNCKKPADKVNGKYCSKEHSPYGALAYKPEKKEPIFPRSEERSKKTPRHKVKSSTKKKRKPKIFVRTIHTRNEKFKQISYTLVCASRALKSLTRYHQPPVEGVYKLRALLKDIDSDCLFLIDRHEKIRTEA